MSESIIATAEHDELLDSIKRTLAAGQLRAARAVNNVLVETYWQIGRDIVQRQEEQGWGTRVVERLSVDLRTAHPDVRGLSVRNLRYMAALATRWPTGIVQQRAAQLPWGHVMVILDFLAADPLRERDLSRALTDNLARFLRELGTGFAFLGAEVPVQCGDREFFLDLLFYHCKLHRYVVFELKLGRFEPEYVGKLNFYVQLVDDHLRDQARDDPTLGMLLVVGRDDVTVEVALRGVSTPRAVTEWRRLPAKVRRALPSAEDLSATVSRTVREVESTTAAA